MTNILSLIMAKARCMVARREIEQSVAEAEEYRRDLAAAKAELARCEQESVANCRRITDLEMELAEAKETLEASMASAAEDKRQALSSVETQLGAMSHHAAEQITAALAEADIAVAEAIDSFSGIAQEAMELANQSESVVNTDAKDSVRSITSHAHVVMGEFVEGMLQTAREIGRFCREIEGVVEVSNRLQLLVDEIEGVADRTMVLALNASIEANRAGKAGAAFGVVADNVRKLSDRSRAAAEEMRSVTGNSKEETHKLQRALGLMAEQSLQSSCEAQESINDMMLMLQRTNDSTNEQLHIVSGKSQILSNEINRVVIAFQFHDLLRQRLEHAAAPLREFRDEHHLADGLSMPDETGGRERMTAGRNWSQISSVGAPPELKIVSYTHDDDDSITLF